MEKLFKDSDVFQKERPTKPTDAQLEVFYLKQANDLKSQGFSTDDEDTRRY